MHKGNNLRLGWFDYNKTAEIALTYSLRKHPEFINRIHEEISNLLPPVIFADYKLIPLFLEDFCQYRNISLADIVGSDLTRQRSQYKKEFLGVLLLCFYPERLLDITQNGVGRGMLTVVRETLQYNSRFLTNIMPIIQSWYQMDAVFRATVDGAHTVIMHKYKHETVPGTFRKSDGLIKNKS